MRIVILTVGSRGDVQPYLALGLGLQAAGHEVYLAANPVYWAFASGHGLSFIAVGGNPREVIEGEEGRSRQGTQHDRIRYLSRFVRSFRPFIRTLRLRMECLLADSWKACQGAEAIICSPTAKAGYHIAEKLKIPCFMAPLQPQSRTRAFPSLLMPPELRLGGNFNWLSHLLFEQFFWQIFRRQINRWRQETLGLPPLNLISPYGRQKGLPLPFLYGYSPSVVPRPPDWPDCLHVTGYWFLDRLSDWQPPADLVDFLAEGPPPVYIGFGSVVDHNSQALTEIALESLARVGQRGILLAGWSGLGKADLPDGVFRIESIPHDWLFPQMAAVVHHGGAGTVAAGLRAGVPSIITPFMADQTFWGYRIARLGAGPSPIHYRHMSVERLASAIRIAVENQSIRRRSAALGRRIRKENGVLKAVKVFDQHLRRRTWK